MTGPLRRCQEPVGEVPLPCVVCDASGLSGVAFRSARWRVCSGCSGRGYGAGERVERERVELRPLAIATKAERVARAARANRALHKGDLVTVRHYVVTPEGVDLEVARGSE